MKAFIIHLSKIQSSVETAVKVKDQLDKFNIESELFEGSYGDETQKLFKSQGKKCYPWGVKGPTRLYSEEEKENLANSHGVLGCFYSHYRLWEKCVELNEPIMIFEDDVVFTRTYYPVDFKDVLILVLGNPQKSEKYMPFLINPQGTPKAEDYYQASLPGTPGYAIQPHAAKILVNEYKNYFLKSDNAINKHFVKLQIHSHLMGRALVADDGKKSLVRTTFWRKLQSKSKSK
jgi:GR25 family glycosyltransferase involved in LPS biosynthesis